MTERPRPKRRSRGTITQKGDRFYAVASYPDPATGARKRWWGPGRKDPKEAQRDLTEFYFRLDVGALVEPNRQTTAQFLQEWLDGMRPPAGKLRPSTWASYSAVIEGHVIPRIGAIGLQKLAPTHLNKLYGDLLAGGRRDGKGSLSQRTVRYVHIILHKALKDAVRWGRLVKNPADLADPPRSKDTQAAEAKVWTPPQLRTFLRHVEGFRLYPLFLLAMTTGMRRGELAGLRWEDVDLESATISVRQTRIAISYKVEVSRPKTARSRRSIGLDSKTVAALRSWRTQQLEERLAWGPAWIDTGLVFTREDGSPPHPEYISRSFLRQAKAAGLPRIRFHDLRHSYATASILAGVPSKVVSARLGHASVGITLDTYSHVLREMDDEAAKKIARLLFG